MNLYVGNLSPTTTEENLKELFSEFGSVKSVKIILDPQTGLSKGFGFVEMEEKPAAYDAIDNLDVTYLLGTIISVKEAKNSKTGNRPGGNKPFQKRPGSGYGTNKPGFNSSRPSYGSREGNYKPNDNPGNRFSSDYSLYKNRENFNRQSPDQQNNNYNDLDY